MTPVQALVLGILQGLGEFLPISSSGHLIVFPWLMGWDVQSLSFDVALHVGTLTAVLWAFRSDWVAIAAGAVQGLRRGNPFAEPEVRLLGLLALGSVPAAVAGVLLADWAETTFRPSSFLTSKARPPPSASSTSWSSQNILRRCRKYRSSTGRS